MDKEQMNWRSFATNDAIKEQWNEPGTPTYYIIDHKRVIRYKWFGNPGERALDTALAALIEQAEAGAKNAPQ